MRHEGIPLVEVHTKDVVHKHIPALWKWATKLKSEFEVQRRVFRTARQDRPHWEAGTAEVSSGQAGVPQGGREGKRK